MPRRRLATVLFIDMVSSTELAASLGDRRWHELLSRYRRVVRRELRHAGGREVDNAGDGFFAVFDEPARALECACALAESVRREGAEVRSGIHMGEVETVGGRLSGIAVHIGSRIVAHAAAGQVLVSSTLRDVVSGSDYTLTDAGTRALKGVPGEWRLFSVTPAHAPQPRPRPRTSVRVRLVLATTAAAGITAAILVLPRIISSAPAEQTERTIITIAGTGAADSEIAGKPATGTSISHPVALAVDSDGRLYIVESNKVRRVNSDGTMATVAGTGVAGFSGDGGPAGSAQLNAPQAIAIDSRGDVYIADSGNNRVRLVAADGLIATFAGTGQASFGGDGGPASLAQLTNPSGVAVGFGGTILIADSGNNRVRAIAPDGRITTFAGTGDLGYAGDAGAATSALLSEPTCLAVDANDNVYIADTLNDRVRRVAVDGTISTVAGTGEPSYSGDGGSAQDAAIHLATGPVSGGSCLAVDNAGNLFIADALNNRVREVAVTNSTVSSVVGNGEPNFAGDDGPARNAALDLPLAVAIDASGRVYVADTDNNRVRRVG